MQPDGHAHRRTINFRKSRTGRHFRPADISRRMHADLGSHRHLSARVWDYGVHLGQQAPQWPAIGRRGGCDRPHGRAGDPGAVIAGFDWGARTADIVAALWPDRCKALVSVSGYLIGSQAAGKAPLPPGRRAPVVVSVLFRHRTRAGRLREIPARVLQADLADRLAEMGVQRAHLRPHRAVVRQSGPRSDRDPQLPLATWPRRRARRNTTNWRSGWPKDRLSPCPRSRWRVTRTAPRTGRLLPTPASSRASTCTGSSRVASATTCRKRHRRPSLKPCSMSPHSNRPRTDEPCR